MRDQNTEQHIDIHEHTRAAFFADDYEVSIEEPRKSISPIPVIPELGMALGLLVLVFGVTYVSIPDNFFTKKQTDTEVYTQLAPLHETPEKIDAYTDTQLTAHSAIVWDAKNKKVLFEKNADEALPLASVTKLMTALVAYELLDPQERVRVTNHALRAEGDSGLRDGEQFTLENIIDLTLISSSNDAATAVSAVGGAVISETNPSMAFVRAMNIKAEELGLTKTHFENPTGLDISPSKAGAYGSARDIALLMEHITRTVPEAIALTNVASARIANNEGVYHLAENTNEYVQKIDGLIASKTGYTTLAGGNLAIAFNAGLDRPIVIVVLGSTYDDRFSDVLTLVTETQRHLSET